MTLTYADEHLPSGGTLVPRDLQLWLKRLRKSCAPVPIRFFACGEYGDVSGRAHYHAIIFGPQSLDMDSLVRSTWHYGFTHIGGATENAFAYVAGYVMKGFAGEDALEAGRHPPFVRMSRRPGLGAGAAPALAAALNTPAVAAEVASRGDVLTAVRIGGQIRPIGRYVRNKLRVESGYPESGLQYRLAALLRTPLQTREELRAARLSHLHRARKIYAHRRLRARI